MRPIDADALMKELEREVELADDWKTAHEIANVVKYFPTIEPERKKGKWIEDARTFYWAVNEKGGGVDVNTPYFTDDIACSECLAKFSIIDNETERFDFCPNCGADMRGEA